MSLVDAVLPWIAAAFVLALLLNAWRLFAGPSLPDRVLALDTLYINALALLVVVGMMLRSSLYFEVAMLIGLLGFVGTVVLSKFVIRGDVVE